MGDKSDAFRGETVGEVEIRPCFLYKSSRGPTWNLYRVGKDQYAPLAQGLRSKTLAWMLAETYNTLTNVMKLRIDREVRESGPKGQR